MKDNRFKEVWSEDATQVDVFLDGNLVFTWNNEANLDYPEDLTWNREIASIFYKGVEVSKKLKETP